MLSLDRVVVQGTVDDPGNVANVEIFRGTKDVGSAHVSANGVWRLTVAPSKPDTSELFSAAVTGGSGHGVTVQAGFIMAANPPEAVGDVE